MARNLHFEFANYAKNKRQLKKILNSTKNNLQEINKSDYFTKDQLTDIRLKEEINQRITEITENPVGIIILGPKSWAKAVVLNELLGYAILPVTPPHLEDSYSANNWRTVRFMYGPQTQVSLAVANCYELVEHLALYDRVWNQIPRADLELREPRESEDNGYYSATLEIKLPHQLLKEDVQIVVAPSPADHYSFESIYHSCFEGVSPLIIYALSESQLLTSKEIDDLMELKRLSPKSPLYFIRAQRSSVYTLPDVSSASELTESQQHLLLKSPLPSPPNSPPSFSGPSSLSQTSFRERLRLLSSAASSISGTNPTNNSNLSAPSLDSLIPTTLTTRSPSPKFDLIDGQSPGSPPSLVQQLVSLGFVFNPPKNFINSHTHHHHHHSHHHSHCATIDHKPCRFPHLFTSNCSRKPKNARVPTSFEVNSELVEDFDNFKTVLLFMRQVLSSYLVEAANLLNDAHNRCLRMFILTAFDMTRDMMITPKRIEYAKQKEQQLFDSLMSIANKKQEEIRNLITITINSMREELVNDAARYKFKFNTRLNSINELEPISKHSGPSNLQPSISSTHHQQQQSKQQQQQQQPVTPQQQQQNQVLNSSGEEIDKYSSPGFCSNNHSLNSPLSSIDTSKLGLLRSLRTNRDTDLTTSSTLSSSSTELHRLSAREIQIAMSEVQDFVLSKLNAAIAGNLIGSVDYLRNSYVGTLERCLESLEKWPVNCIGIQLSPQSKIESLQASNALKQILNAAYAVEINMRTTSNLIRAFWEKMKQLVSVSLSWRHQTVIDEEWKRKVAIDVLDSLSESRLAKSICSQFKERLRLSHEQFAAAMKQLEAVHYGRLERTEEQRVRVRKYYAPRIARYALESTSLRDMILFGMPEIGREIGRGQYGVVYSCDSWAGCSPVALKSVVPPDEKHWNDLAMEFYYTRSIPEHDRIVQIRGSVIDHTYGGGATPAVLLIMDRLSRDLYSAIKNGLDWLSRLQVAIDVVQGIRFLHSQGLVHRDIKLKNVLLDKRNRAKITDLGFCKPEAMMSGSIVGTPIHMAPELFTGKYDNSVDVYAFGILFWYICAGHVRLPYIFEQCQNKDQLWSCVRKGVRPERLPQFDDDCWAIMEACWAKESSQRPLLGDIEPKLSAILESYKTSKPPAGYNKNYMRYRSANHSNYQVTKNNDDAMFKDNFNRCKAVEAIPK